MSKNYRSGFERLSRIWTDTDERYMNALLAIKDNFTGFTKKAGYDPSHPEKLTASQKHQIRRYYNTLTEYSEGGPVYKMKPSELPKEIKQYKEKGTEAVKRAAQMHHGRKRSKFIFLKYDGENIPKISIRNGAPVFENVQMGYSYETIELNKKALAVKPMDTVKAIAPLTQGAKFYRIMAGKHEFYNAADLTSLGNKIIQLQGKYQVGNHAWENWLHGVKAYYTVGNVKAKDVINYENKYKQSYKELQQKIKRENAKLRTKRKGK